MFFEQTKETKQIDPLYDNLCVNDLQCVGSTCKLLEMTRNDAAI